MKNKRELFDIMAYDGLKNANEDRKMKKFFRFAVPILIIEIIASIGCLVFYFITPKNYCVVTSPKNSVVYINDDKTDKVKFQPPKESTKHYFYDINISIVLPEGNYYKVTFILECSKYKVYAKSPATKENDEFTMTVKGGEKTEVVNGITIVSNKLIKNFTVYVRISAKKI